MSNYLSEQQIKAFRETGYFVVRKLFSAGEMDAMAAWADELQNWPEVPGKHMMYFEKSAKDHGRILNRLENFLPYHEPFRRLCLGERMAGMVTELFGEPAVLFKDKINFKMPGGDGFAPHQDVQAGWSCYASIHITALVSIDPATKENGCLEMAARFHDQGLIGDEWTPLSEQDTADMEFVSVETEPGDAVFFDSFAPHKSAPNLTDRARRVLYITYNPASEGDHLRQYYQDKRQSYPPDIEREAGRSYVFRV
jgi:ectoine hydroxylase-related dioxygenase (phytanoyl-CoA dioxygenase family)